MNLYEFRSYKEFVNERIAALPGGGRGQFRELAEKLRMHTTLVSQVFRGDRHLTPEQACDLCQHWGLSELETELFLLLVQYEKAGSAKLRDILGKQLDRLQIRAQKLEHRLPDGAKLSDEAQAVFYSNWYYSAIRLLTSIPKFGTIDAISQRLNLPRKTVAKVTEFLLAHGLCVKGKNGIGMGPKRTHLSSDSPLVGRHHTNWRMKSVLKAESLLEHELMFTAPISISEKDARKVRKLIVAMIESVSETVKDTDPEKLVCLNVDWVDV